MSKMIDKTGSMESWEIETCAIAAVRLMKGLQSERFDFGLITSKDFEKVQVIVNEKGLLDVKARGSAWHRSVKLAPDVHSTNLNIVISKNDSIRTITFHMEVIKAVEIGEELLMWFSDDVLAMIDMPFLTPKNIAGHKKYRCHVCDDEFEYPNPLKTHLLLNCRDQNIWRHIEKLIKIKSPSPPLKIEVAEMSSAFIPYRKVAPSPFNLITTHTVDPQSKFPRTFEEISNNYAADIELFASNWGKLKQGHLCVYCGKVYSRKYGLKIHIRTHTGYKPLKCKYCLRPFGDPSNLNKHVRLHASGMTQYVCTLCGKILVRRRDLERHLKTQHEK